MEYSLWETCWHETAQADLGETPMNAERRRALEKELQDILKITNPLVPATLDPNSPTPMSVPEVEAAAETKR
jgi:hypothetical protein